MADDLTPAMRKLAYDMTWDTAKILPDKDIDAIAADARARIDQWLIDMGCEEVALEMAARRTGRDLLPGEDTD